VADSAANTIDVFLIAGQSNADGRAKTNGLPLNLQGNQTDVPFVYGNSSTAYSGLTVLKPSTSSMGGFGPEITFGRSMADYYSGSNQSVALLKYAYGGSSLYSDWMAGGTSSTIGDGTKYQSFQSTVSAGLAALQSAFPTAIIVISGVLWVQGEADIDAATDGSAPNAVSNYAANLTALINDMRLTYGNPTLPFLLSRISSHQTYYSDPAANSYSNYLALRNQQALVASSVANTFLINTDGSSFTTANPINTPGLHYDAGGQQALGYAFASKMQVVLVPEPTGAALLVCALLGCGLRRKR